MSVETDRPERLIADVGRRVAELRRARGWTQQEAAEALRMPVKNLQRIEAGMNLTLRTLVRVATGLGVRARELFVAPTSREKRRPGRPKRGPSAPMSKR